jgi:hypothetical protein
MTFTEHTDCFIWQCDGEDCEKEVMFAPHDFMACVAELKSRGWGFSVYEITGREEGGRTWHHYCAACRQKIARRILDHVPRSAVKVVK